MINYIYTAIIWIIRIICADTLHIASINVEYTKYNKKKGVHLIKMCAWISKFIKKENVDIMALQNINSEELMAYEIFLRDHCDMKVESTGTTKKMLLACKKQIEITNKKEIIKDGTTLGQYARIKKNNREYDIINVGKCENLQEIKAIKEASKIKNRTAIFGTFYIDYEEDMLSEMCKYDITNYYGNSGLKESENGYTFYHYEDMGFIKGDNINKIKSKLIMDKEQDNINMGNHPINLHCVVEYKIKWL